VSHVLAIDIGGTHFRVGIFDDTGERLAFAEGNTDRSGGRDWMLQQIQEQTTTLMDRLDQPLTACGISFGGPVNFTRQTVTSIHTPGWQEFPLGE